MNIYKQMVRPVLFALSQQDPEVAHEMALWALKRLESHHPKLRRRLSAATSVEDWRCERLGQNLFDVSFRNPVGLAAGFDKNGEAIHGLAALGFGFLEIGTVTMNPQEGNPRPRMFRLINDHALINRMGFNNHGVEAMMRMLNFADYDETPLGISLGKLKATPMEGATTEYAALFHALHHLGDYFVINVSSPNTPNLRNLQDKDQLRQIIVAMKRVNAQMTELAMGIQRPVLVKIAPDLSWGAIDDVLDVCLSEELDGIIAANTTIGRAGLMTLTTETGGLSGKPLWPKSHEIVRYIYRRTEERLPIIGVGGISTAEQAFAMLKTGASLVQILTSLVYEGPFVVRDINRGLLEIFDREGIKHISEIIGKEAHRAN